MLSDCVCVIESVFSVSDAACAGSLDVFGADRNIVRRVALRSEGKASPRHGYAQDYSAVMSRLVSPDDCE